MEGPANNLMTESKQAHTPGPRRAIRGIEWGRPGCGFVLAADGETVIGRFPRYGDAVLDAAAPDLLAALIEAVEYQNEDTECLMADDAEETDCPDGRCTHGCMVARVNRWRAAIARATGGAP